LVSLVIYEWRHSEPIVDVRLFKNFNFATANMVMFMVGAISFASTVLMPQFLQSLMGYTAEKAGIVMSAAAMVLLMELPIVGQLTTRIQARYLIAFGWFALTCTMFYSTRRIDLEMSFGAATTLRILQYIPLGFVFIPSSTAAYTGIAPEKNNAVAGLVNFMRNIGSSVGTSVVTTLLARRSQFHQERLTENATGMSHNFQAAIAGMAQQFAQAGMNAADATRHATARFYAQLQAQAATLAYIDTYFVISVAAGIMFLFSFGLKKNKPGTGPKGAAH
jgi:DHA2 family multidrug resistance protein